jgi:transcriptional regulator with XRE-family HTH domain
MSALSELLSGANAGGLSAREIARRAQESGFSLNHDTVARYLRGDHGRPDEPTLIAFSAVLTLPLGRLRTAAGLPSEVVEPYVPPTEAGRLSRRQRKAVDEIIRAMLEPPARESGAHSAEVASLPRPGTGRGARPGEAGSGEVAPAVPRAARRGRREADKS